MHIKEELIRLIYGTSCESEFESQPGSCQYRRYGICGIIGKIDFCAATHLADHLIANGVTVQRWIPVAERLPEEGDDVLVFGYWHERYQPLKCHLSPHYKGRWFTSVAGQEVYAVTHWMPLPEPPKEE